jgi:hypothetical protein
MKKKINKSLILGGRVVGHDVSMAGHELSMPSSETMMRAYEQNDIMPEGITRPEAITGRHRHRHAPAARLNRGS